MKMSIVKKIFPKSIASMLVGVQPMSATTGQIFNMMYAASVPYREHCIQVSILESRGYYKDIGMDGKKPEDVFREYADEMNIIDECLSDDYDGFIKRQLKK